MLLLEKQCAAVNTQSSAINVPVQLSNFTKKALDIGQNLSDDNVISVIWHDSVLKMKGGRMYNKILEFLTSHDDVKIMSGVELVKILK